MNIAGIVSGMDTGALLDAVRQAQNIPVNQVRARQQAISTKISKLGSLSNKLSGLRTLVEKMTSGDGGLVSLTGTSTDEDIMTATAKGGAVNGQYAMDVTQLAVAKKERSAAFNSVYSGVTAGTLTIGTPGEDPIDIIIEEGDALKDVVAKINGSGAAVSASIINDGTNSYLQIVAEESGHEIGGAPGDAITITETSTGTTGTALGLTEVVAAQNATMTLDGLAVESRSNTMSDVLEGVSIEVHKLGEVTLDMRVDREATKENIEAFVDAFNSVQSFIRNEQNVTEGEDRSTSLATDPIARTIRARLSEAIGLGVDDIGSMNTLNGMGIRLTVGGKLSIDSDDLDSAMDGDLAAIQDLFTSNPADATNAQQGLAVRLESVISQFLDGGDVDDEEGTVTDFEGLLKSRQEALKKQADGMDDHIIQMEERIEKNLGRMQRQFTAMEQAMQQYNSQNASLVSLLG